MQSSKNRDFFNQRAKMASDINDTESMIGLGARKQKADNEYWQYQRKFNGVFDCHGGYIDDRGKQVRYQYSKTSLYCMDDENKLRIFFVWLATWKWFDRFVTLAIIVNSFMLGTTDYETRLNPKYESTWTPLQEQIDVVFSSIFIMECTVKVISMGFCMHKLSYLREPWNCLDFFIVCISLIGFLPVKGGSDSLKSLRTFRILRPLRSINRMPAMRQQIQALLGSIPGLMRVFFFIIFIFSIFAIFGTNQFAGEQYQFCRATEKPQFTDGVFKSWTKLGDDGDGPVLCHMDSQCLDAFPDADVAVCGSIYEKTGLDPIDHDDIRNIELIMYGIPGFDNVAQGFLAIFQILTLESWVYLMYNFGDTDFAAISVIFFVSVVIIGAFFTMNLVLAIIVDAFNSYNDEVEAEKNEKQSKFAKTIQGEDEENSSTDSQGNKDEKADLDELKKQYPVFFDEDSEDGQYEETPEERQIRIALKQRVGKSGFVKKVHDLVTSVSFNFTIFLLILGNTATLAAYTYDQSDSKTLLLNKLNDFFTWIFALEMLLKLIGLGWQNYKQDSYNLFDASIVIISLVDFTLSHIPSLNVGQVLNAFRALRLLRLLKLAKVWTKLAEILQKTAKSFKDISNFSLLLVLFMYIFALLGMELFANIALIDGDDNLVVGEQSVMELYASGSFYTFPRDNFNNVGWALTTVFIIIIGEDWNWTMYQWVRAYGYASSVSYHIAIYFFVLLMIFGNIVLFSLFTAILLQNFEGSDDDEDDDEKKAEDVYEDDQLKPTKWQNFVTGFKEAFGQKKRLQQKAKDDLAAGQNQLNNLVDFQKKTDSDKSDGSQRQDKEDGQDQKPKLNLLVHYNPKYYAPKDINFTRRSTLVSELEETEPLPDLMGTSTCCLGKDNCFRLACNVLAEHQYFQRTILILIVISTVTLAFETPLDNPESEKIKILGYIDIFMTSAFTFEMVVKIIAKGFAFAGSESYIRGPWNILDFIIVSSALLSILAADLNIEFFKSLRILRILRPLRIIARDKGLKIAIAALGASLPNIFNLQVITLFFVFLFAILQTTLLSGAFYSCNTDNLALTMKQQTQNIETMWDCLNYGGEWIEPDLNFDTTFTSLLTLVTIQTTEGWTDVMWASVDAVGPYQQPKENHNIFMVAYTMFMIIIICMLFIELFVGIVTETFNSQKELMSGNKTLDIRQRAWVEVQLMSLNSKPKGKAEEKDNPMRKCCIQIVEDKKFDTFIMYCIMGNTLVLSFYWYMQSEVFEAPLGYLNTIFVIIFTAEAAIKIIALCGLYFKDSWNRFDFSIVMGTLIVIMIQTVANVEDLEILATIIRTLRICRVLRLVKKQQKLQEIFETLLQAAPAMASLGILLMLLIFMFSIIGMAQFSLVNLDGAAEMNQHVNFQSFGSAFLTLMRCSTGEAWNSIMFDSSQSFSILYECKEEEDYYSIIARGDDPGDVYGPKGCGNGFAVVFHILFQVIVSQVFLNLFIAIIIDAFFGQTELAKIPIKQKSIDEFILFWSYYDKNADGFISLKDCQALLKDLAGKADPSEGGRFIPFKKQILNDPKFLKRQLMVLEIPTHSEQEEKEISYSRHSSQDTQESQELTAVKVFFYDVLLKLCYQSIRIHYLGYELKQIQSTLEAMKRFGGRPIHSDFLTALEWRNPFEVHEFDKSLIGLEQLVNEKKPKATIIQELKSLSKALEIDYGINMDVDTNQRFERSKHNKKVELYTTRHFVSSEMIYDYVDAYLFRRNRVAARRASQNSFAMSSGGGGDLQAELGEAARDIDRANSARQKLIQAQPGLPSAQVQLVSGLTENDPQDDGGDESIGVLQSDHFGNLNND